MGHGNRYTLFSYLKNHLLPVPVHVTLDFRMKKCRSILLRYMKVLGRLTEISNAYDQPLDTRQRETQQVRSGRVFGPTGTYAFATAPDKTEEKK